MWGKYKASSPRQAFPLCLQTAVKQGSFQKKKNYTFTILVLQKSCQIYSMMFSKHSLSHFFHLLTSRCKWIPTSIVSNLGIYE